MKKVYTQTKEIEICGNYDVIVVGGGAAGCAAALTAGRLGAEVLLCERYGFLAAQPLPRAWVTFCLPMV